MDMGSAQLVQRRNRLTTRGLDKVNMDTALFSQIMITETHNNHLDLKNLFLRIIRHAHLTPRKSTPTSKSF